MSAPGEPPTPDPDHAIAIEPFNGQVRVVFAHYTVADTTRALELRETSYSPVYYVPLTDVDRGALRHSDTTTHCPDKGEASYYDVIDPHTLQSVDDAVWRYREPHASVPEIAEFVAFYPHKVDIEVQPAG